MAVFSLLLVLVAAAIARADDILVYQDGALASQWQDWSWGSTISYAATDIAEGSSSISVTSQAWSALSLYYPTPFGSFAGLEFDIAGAQPDVSLQLTDVTNNVNSASIPLSAFSTSITADGFTHVLLNFASVPPNSLPLGTGAWDRITFQAGGNGATYHLDNINVIEQITITPKFLSAEPLGNNIIAATTVGAVDLSTVSVKLNGKTIPIKSNVTTTATNTPSKTITYFTLASGLAPGNLVIAAGGTNFTFALPAKQNTNIDHSHVKPISPLIYGVNWPTSASYIQDLGVSISRWGGNAVTAYNPFGDFTNAGSDWFFENRANDGGSADSWLAWVAAAGSKTFLTIPALDWVAKDTTSYSYSAATYPDQKAFDPYKPDAGDGLFPNGSYITPVPSQTTAYTVWNSTAAKQWLSNLVHKPSVVTIDNEIEIASNTHQDMHPDPIGYDEELARVIEFGTMAKEALPSVQVAAPSTCAWWYYWTSVIGFTDNAAHNNTDFIPWFLQQMAAHDKATGKRILDFLDIHFYYQGDTSANDDAAKAMRLRMTRALWDPTYVDESWVGTSTPQNHQPNATIIQVIPRMQKLIQQFYPGTKLSISEWNSQGDGDITGGLGTADALGIFGRFGVDSATYWSDPDETSATALAYWLFNGSGVKFGNLSLQVNVTGFNPDVLGVYAATSPNNKVSLVVINKDPSKPVALNVSGLPTGKYTLRHFGGLAGVAKWQTSVQLGSASYVVVPAYTALFLLQA